MGDVHDLEVGEDEHAVLLLLQLGQELVEQHQLAAGRHEEVGLVGEGQVARLVLLLELRRRGEGAEGRVRGGGGRGGLRGLGYSKRHGGGMDESTHSRLDRTE